MSYAQFNLSILEQGWLQGLQPGEDMCSHGKIRLEIGGQLIAGGEIEYGISTSALFLLRTLTENYRAGTPQAFEGHQIQHGCSAFIFLAGCPIGIEWTVEHKVGNIVVSDVVRYDDTNESHGIRFPLASTVIPEETYNKAIVDFAKAAKAPFQGLNMNLQYREDLEEWPRFWNEYDTLLARFDIGRP